MFAVKGWNLTAQIKTQVAPPPPQKAGAADDLGTNGKKASKKRKRAADSDSPNQESNGPKGQTNNHTEQQISNEQDKKPAKTLKQKQKERKQQENASSQASAAAEIKKKEDTDELHKQVIQGSSGGPTEGENTSRAKKKKKRNRKSKQDGVQEADGKNGSSEATKAEAMPVSEKVAQISESIPAQPPPAPSNLTPLQAAMRQKLLSSRFRHLNETLYTTKSAESAELFRTNPSFFTEYHEGFARQVSSWPENPVDGFAALLVARGSLPSKGYTPGKMKGLGEHGRKVREKADRLNLASRGGGASAKTISAAPGAVSMGTAEPLPRDHKSKETIVADLGCGTGVLAQQIQPFTEALRLRLHSFDLASPNEHVTIADIRNLPLPDSSVDIAVFSLALMGTNWIDFIEEAWRVLKWKGECWIADVNSRFAGQGTTLGTKAIGSSRAGHVVAHSVGARVKNGAVGKNGTTNDQDGDDEEAFLDENENDDDDNHDQDHTSSSTGTPRKKDDSGTDVSAFVAVLHRRGFALLGDPDVSNKMFARMRFAKALIPSRGKCSRQSLGHDRRTNGRGGMMGPSKRFIDKKGPEDDVKVEDEARVLKPCVYKTR